MTAHITQLRSPALMPGTQPSLEGLSWLLRHPRAWPENFWWDYSSTETCAVGLADQTWGLGFQSNPQAEQLARTFDVSWEVARDIFYRVHHQYEVGRRGWRALFFGRATPARLEHVTPGMVADRIDELLARRAA